MTPSCGTIQMKAIDQYFHVLQSIVLHEMAVNFNSGENPNVGPLK